MSTCKNSVWINNGKVNRRVPLDKIESLKELGWFLGRFGFTVTSAAKEHRARLAATRADKLRKYGFTDEQVSAERKAGKRWCSPHRRFESTNAFVNSRSRCCRVAEQARSLTRKCQRYNITLDWYTTQLDKQRGHCALCPSTQYSSSNKGPLAIDHNHKCCPTDACCCGMCIRGLLCSACNLRIYELERFIEEAVIIPISESWTSCALTYLRATKKLDTGLL